MAHIMVDDWTTPVVVDGRVVRMRQRSLRLQPGITSQERAVLDALRNTKRVPDNSRKR